MIPGLGTCTAINIERNNTHSRLTLPGVYSGTEFRGDAYECVFLPDSIVGCELSRNRQDPLNRDSERIIVGIRGGILSDYNITRSVTLALQCCTATRRISVPIYNLLTRIAAKVRLLAVKDLLMFEQKVYFF